MNAIGNAKNAFSVSWVKTATRRNTANGRQMKANLRRYFTELTPEIHGSKRMWSTFKDDGMPYLMRNGWKSSFVVYNQRATNDYADRTNLVYFANIFMHPDLKNCLRHHNIEPDEDGYALSIFLQWIWRSAIRNGEEIYIYVPSSRMRRLLKEWIVRCEKEYHAFYGTADVQPREADEAAAFEKSVAATGAAPVLCEKSGDEKGRINKQSNPAA